MTKEELKKIHGILDRITTVATVALLLCFAIIYFFNLSYPQLAFRIFSFGLMGFLIAAIGSLIGKIIVNILYFKKQKEDDK